MYTDLGNRIGDRSLLTEIDRNYYKSYESGSNKYRVFRENVQKDLSTRIQAILNWSNASERTSLVNDDTPGLLNNDHSGLPDGDGDSM